MENRLSVRLDAGSLEAASTQRDQRSHRPKSWVPMLLEQALTSFTILMKDKTLGAAGPGDGGAQVLRRAQSRVDQALLESSDLRLSFMHIVPDDFAFQRYVEAKVRIDNPDEPERMRDLTPMVMMEGHFSRSTDNSARRGCSRF